MVPEVAGELQTLSVTESSCHGRKLSQRACDRCNGPFFPSQVFTTERMGLLVLYPAKDLASQFFPVFPTSQFPPPPHSGPLHQGFERNIDTHVEDRNCLKLQSENLLNQAQRMDSSRIP